MNNILSERMRPHFRHGAGASNLVMLTCEHQTHESYHKMMCLPQALSTRSVLIPHSTVTRSRQKSQGVRRLSCDLRPNMARHEERTRPVGIQHGESRRCTQ